MTTAVRFFAPRSARCWCTIPTWGNMGGINKGKARARVRALKRTQVPTIGAAGQAGAGLESGGDAGVRRALDARHGGYRDT